MANDRVFIQCNVCGGWKMLLKFFPGTLATMDNGILEWLDTHGPCHPRFFSNDLGGNPGFKLFTESDAKELPKDKYDAEGPGIDSRAFNIDEGKT